MIDWPDEKIRNNASWYIQKHSTDPESWRYTHISRGHPEVRKRCGLQLGELVIVTSFISDASWYALTSRRIIGLYRGKLSDLQAVDVIEDKFRNFKGYRGVETEIMTLRRTGQPDTQLEYETGKASMAPMYYFRFWAIKYPVLDKLRHDPNTRNMT